MQNIDCVNSIKPPKEIVTELTVIGLKEIILKKKKKHNTYKVQGKTISIFSFIFKTFETWMNKDKVK